MSPGRLDPRLRAMSSDVPSTRRRSSSTAPLQPRSKLENLRSGLNKWFSGRSTVGTAQHDVPESPKTPRPTLGLQDLPSVRLHIPYLPRSNSNSSARSHGSRGSSRSFRHPFHSANAGDVEAGHTRQHSRQHSQHPSVGGIPRVHRSSTGRRFVGVDPAELHLADLAASGRRRRKQKVGKSRAERTCGPKIKNRKIRAKILSCFISGLFLTLVLTVYLAMALSNRNESQEFHVLLILVILITTIFFCHALVRLCMMIIKPPPEDDLEAQILPPMIGPGGYANPVAPIPVTLARDEDAVGIESPATKIPPPAYGLWRESVRVDPNRIFWQRNAAAEHVRQDSQTDGRPATANRPPSYISENGIDYVVEPVPRSIAPTTDVPLMTHPSERGRLDRLPSA